MIKKMVSHGNSAALIIDKPILEILKIDMDTPLEVSTDGKNLIISPVQDAKREARFRAALQKVNKKHEKTLRKLAKS
ncbi:MAG: AbrB/MazE/SpoVT family DNA-binding domain-containing protein [Nitrospirota bacterium]|nr:AbrB/MazE/SpoVT family DNA-binding domain-containing protein [Nitrospirota bacterium]MDH5769317.1 AbrB/MazE/SpoVT family DNA-binding domain-containing protein [Nitrospirota bacterium]